MALKDDFDHAKVFVSNVFNGTVSRIDLSLPDTDRYGRPHHSDRLGIHASHGSCRARVGTEGLFYDGATDVLYVASTADNAIFKIPHASTTGPSSGTGKLIFTDTHLRGPLALALAPNGHLLTSNGNAINPESVHPSEIVEFTKTGHFIGEYNIHQNQASIWDRDVHIG